MPEVDTGMFDAFLMFVVLEMFCLLGHFFVRGRSDNEFVCVRGINFIFCVLVIRYMLTLFVAYKLGGRAGF